MVLLGAAAAFVLQFEGAARLASRGLRRVARAVDAVPARAMGPLLLGAAFAAALFCVPGYRWAGAVSGDEPKYLRIAQSLVRDGDIDVSQDAATPLTARGLALRLRRTAAAVIKASGPGPESPPGHVWNLGNWTVAGRGGGQYHVQLPGLPLLLVVPLALEERVLGARADHPYLTIFMAGLWAVAFTHTALFAARLSGHRLAGLAAATAACASVPVFIGGLHFYPEAAAVAAVPWLGRVALEDEPPRLHRLLLAALVAGALPWLHPKFVLLSLAGAGLVLWRARGDRLRVLAIGLAWAAPVLLLLRLCGEITGLFRPDAFYVRYGSDLYSGAGDVLRVRTVMGLFGAFFAARDGLFVLAPVLMAGVFAAVWAWRTARRGAAVAGILFAATWLAAATHMGAAPGPPGRLMAPAAWCLAAALAVGLARARERPAFGWCAALLVLPTLALTIATAQEWRRTVNPHRGVPAARSPAPDLPDHPRAPGERPFAPVYELAKGALLAALVVAGAWAFARSPATGGGGESWPPVRNVHLALWSALAVAAYGLHAAAPP